MVKQYRHVLTDKIFEKDITGKILTCKESSETVPFSIVNNSKEWEELKHFDSKVCVITKFSLPDGSYYKKESDSDLYKFIQPKVFYSFAEQFVPITKCINHKKAEISEIFVPKTGQTYKIGDSISLLKIMDSRTLKPAVTKIVGFFIPWENEDGDLWIRTDQNFPNIRVSTATGFTRAKVEPLFIDELGKPVYEGEYWFYVTDKYKGVRRTNTLTYAGTKTNKVFRFKESTDATNFLNKYLPVLSYTDVEKFFKGTKGAEEKRTALLTMALSKIKNKKN